MSLVAHKVCESVGLVSRDDTPVRVSLLMSVTASGAVTLGSVAVHGAMAARVLSSGATANIVLLQHGKPFEPTFRGPVGWLDPSQ